MKHNFPKVCKCVSSYDELISPHILKQRSRLNLDSIVKQSVVKLCLKQSDCRKSSRIRILAIPRELDKSHSRRILYLISRLCILSNFISCINTWWALFNSSIDSTNGEMKDKLNKLFQALSTYRQIESYMRQGTDTFFRTRKNLKANLNKHLPPQSQSSTKKQF